MPKCVDISNISPVPLQATGKGMSFFEANAISKAIMRAAIYDACSKNKKLVYFPSYEIVTQIAPAAGLVAFDDDDGHPRHVNQSLVSTIVDLFLETYSPGFLNIDKI